MATPPTQATVLAIDAGSAGKPISPDLFGVFFEDLNHAADGGLYAELIQNRSFEYRSTAQPEWHALSFWETVRRGGAEGRPVIDVAVPLHPNNPHCVILAVERVGDGLGLANKGFDGLVIREGETYDFSVFARQIYIEDRWGTDSHIEGRPMPLSIRLEGKGGELLGEADLEVVGRQWTRYRAAVTARGSDEEATFVLLAKRRGGVALDEVSLFPRKTFKGRPNGLRADLAQVIADLRPRFVRFPGGCLAHGNGINNIYRWQDTVGPIEQRRGQHNLWNYHQSVGLGYFEYFQFCEDIGAKPVPVVAAGVSCQNSGHLAHHGQQAIPLEDMPAYIQDVLDLIEWANGPADSRWGRKRAEAGHPEPFGLQYLGVGNEDRITPEFEERFQMIYDAVRARHPGIVVIGTSGPFHSGEDFDAGWAVAGRLAVPMVDEHYYEKPDWFWDNLQRYERYNRGKSKVYLGEYAAHEPDRRSTLRAALAEAAFLTALERDGDVVSMASYAPLLCKRGHHHWTPDLIYFTNTRIARTVSYYVQQLFGVHAGDRYLPVRIEGTPEGKFAASCVRDSRSGDVIVKIVNGDGRARPLRLDLRGTDRLTSTADVTVLAGPDALAANTLDDPGVVMPQVASVELRELLDGEVPPYSLTVIRVKAASWRVDSPKKIEAGPDGISRRGRLSCGAGFFPPRCTTNPMVDNSFSHGS